MIKALIQSDLEGNDVLDLGTGTGILAILASKIQAKKVFAIDIDPWSVENCRENVKLNNCNNITTYQGDSSAVPDRKFDYILANINRNVLIDYMSFFRQHLREKGILLLSGIITDDDERILIEAKRAGFRLKDRYREDEWLAMNLVIG